MEAPRLFVLLAAMAFNGCASWQPNDSISASYRNLMVSEDTFEPRLFKQNPNREPTYLAENLALAAIEVSLGKVNGTSPRPKSKRARQRAMLALMKQYGISACFVSFPSRDPEIARLTEGYTISVEEALRLQREHVRGSKLFEEFIKLPQRESTTLWGDMYKLK